jgi:hypothetical protein
MYKQTETQTPQNPVNSPTHSHLQPRPFAVQAQDDDHTQGVTKPELQSDQKKVQKSGFNLINIMMAANNASTPLNIQPKLEIGEAGDQYEQEADRVASQVVSQINKPIQKKLQRLSETEMIQRQLAIASQPQKRFIKPFNIKSPNQSVQRQEAIAGGTASTDLESSIQSARGGGQALASNLQESMGQAMGADFSGVKVHTDSRSDQLNKSIQAKAFTTGQDVFFRQGAYEPSSRGGQELIAHELTHTIQQGGSKIQRKANAPLITSACQTLQAAPSLLQRKSLVVNGVASTHKIVGGKDTKADKNKYVKGSIADISDTDTDHLKNTTGEIEWYRLNPPEDLKYIRASKVYADVNVAPTTLEDPENEDDLLDSFNENAVGTTEEGLDSYSEETEELGGDTAQLDIAGGAMGTVGGILGMASAIKTLMGSEGNWDDWVGGIWDILVSSGNLTSGISKIISSASESESNLSESSKGVSDWSGGFAGAMDTISGAVKTIRNVVEIIKMWSSDEKYGRDEYAKVGSDIVSGALTTAKGVVESVKNFIDIFNGPIGTLAQAIPAISIAVSATKMIVESYYLASSAYSWTKMKKEAESLTQDLTTKGKVGINEAKKTYQTKRAEISNLDAREAEKEAKNQDRQIEIDELTFEKTTLVTEKANLDRELNNSQTSKTRKEEINKKLTGSFLGGSGIVGRMKSIDTRVSVLTEERNTTAPKIIAAQQSIAVREAEMSDYATQNNISQEDIAEVELAEELKTGNRKRIVRQSIHLVTDAVQIAGSIATLTGVGAIGGVATSASAAGVELSLPFFRSIKEYGRKKAAESQAKGESGTLSQMIFDPNKSSKAKLDARKRHTSTIFKMVNNLNTVKTTDPTKLPASVSRVETFIKAAGCEPKALYRLNGKLDAQASLILKSLYKREF